MTQVSLYCWAVRGSKWEENLFFCRIGRCCSNEIPERSGHKGEWCSHIRIMTSRKACCCKNIMVLVRDKYMFSIVEYRILILFDRLFILGNATEPCFCLCMSCSSSLQWVFFFLSILSVCFYGHEQCNYWHWNVTSQLWRRVKVLFFRSCWACSWRRRKIRHTWPKQYPPKFHCGLCFICCGSVC